MSSNYDWGTRYGPRGDDILYRKPLPHRVLNISLPTGTFKLLLNVRDGLGVRSTPRGAGSKINLDKNIPVGTLPIKMGEG